MSVEPRAVRSEDYAVTPPMMPMRIGSPAMWGLAEDIPYWQAVSRLYDMDNVVGAYELAVELGAGRNARGLSMFRLVDAERDVRVRGTRHEVTDWFGVEYIPSEQGERIQALAQVALKKAGQERDRFCWQGKEKVLLALLAQEMDASWATARFGYCAQKTEYYKICVPHHATQSEDRFEDVFGHEFAHVMSLSQSKQRLSKWLGEGFSVYVSREFSDRSRQVFLSRPHHWLNPQDLELQFGPGIDLGSADKWLAYQQAGWITLYMAKLKGEKELMVLLDQFADEGFLRNLKLMALGESRTADAIKQVYRMSQAELFLKARASLQAPGHNGE